MDLFGTTGSGAADLRNRWDSVDFEYSRSKTDDEDDDPLDDDDVTWELGGGGLMIGELEID
jgi:hypothetical protein